MASIMFRYCQLSRRQRIQVKFPSCSPPLPTTTCFSCLLFVLHNLSHPCSLSKIQFLLVSQFSLASQQDWTSVFNLVVELSWQAICEGPQRGLEARLQHDHGFELLLALFGEPSSNFPLLQACLNFSTTRVRIRSFCKRDSVPNTLFPTIWISQY